MSQGVFQKDREIEFPHFLLLKASAGSGKTYALSRRFVQFLLSGRIPDNDLRQVLAITFSNNAAKEMKERILRWLKETVLEEDTAEELLGITTPPGEPSLEGLKKRAEELITRILRNYTDLQVKTIDSFLAGIFRASAYDLGLPPDFEITLQPMPMIRQAFNLFIMPIRPGSPEAGLFEGVLERILEARGGRTAYIWDPGEFILEEITRLHTKLNALGLPLAPPPEASGMRALEERAREIFLAIEKILNDSGLEMNSRSTFLKRLPLIKRDDYSCLIGLSTKTPPVKKIKPGDSRSGDHGRILSLWEELGDIVSEYTFHHASTFLSPYLEVFRRFEARLQEFKRELGTVFIEDIASRIITLLDEFQIPDIYFRLGERIHHYLIDEFQDTSPVQWRTIYPLIENSLSERGSLFVVGDTKQAIYRFREADYQIMKSLEKGLEGFPSAPFSVRELHENYRSAGVIVDYAKRIFREAVPAAGYGEAAVLSGLTDFEQSASSDKKEEGYLRVSILEKDDSGTPEKARLLENVRSLRNRGFRYRDIAILTLRNFTVETVSSWLNEKDIPFISHSSLDIRKRKTTGEILALLRFLDSPIDDLSFGEFLLSRTFQKATAGNPAPEVLRDFILSVKEDPPLYRRFRDHYPGLWDRFFSRLYRLTGYLPLYDLLTDLYAVFGVFETMKDEEAVLARLLEVVKEFEAAGGGGLRDFIVFFSESEDETLWSVEAPSGTDAVNVMTIHKAKGLGFPVVILLLYEEKLNRGFGYIVDTREDGVHLLRIKGTMKDVHPELQELYDTEVNRNIVDSLNTLYVGLTRAKTEMHIIGVRENKEKEKYPFDIIREETAGSPASPTMLEDETGPEPFPLLPGKRGIEITPSPERSLSMEEKKRGEFFHQILSEIEYAGDLPERTIEEAARRVPGLPDETRDEALRILGRFLSYSSVRSWFEPLEGRVILREQEFTDRYGNIHRPDRVVIDPGGVTVIDFKTGDIGGEREEGYRRQVETYMAILRDVYKRPVTGIIAGLEGPEIRVVGQR